MGNNKIILIIGIGLLLIIGNVYLLSKSLNKEVVKEDSNKNNDYNVPIINLGSENYEDSYYPEKINDKKDKHIEKEEKLIINNIKIISSEKILSNRIEYSLSKYTKENPLIINYINNKKQMYIYSNSTSSILGGLS